MQGPIDLPPPPPLRPRTVGEILEAAFGLYAKHWKSLITIVAIVVIPLTLIQYLIGDSLASDITTQQNGQVVVQHGGGGTFASAGVVWLLSLLIEQILFGAVIWAVASILIGREPDVADAYRIGYRRVWSVLLVSILVVLAAMVGFILLIVPGIIVLVRLSVSVPAVVVEGKRGTGALGRSWNLVRGQSWSVFGAFLVVLFLSAIVNGVLTALGGNSWVATGLLAAIGNCITTPFFGLVVGLIYFDLRVRKEQLDLPTLERELQAAAS